MCAVAGSSHQKGHVRGLSACNDTREFVVAVSDCSVHGVTVSSMPVKRLCVHGAEFEHALLVGLFQKHREMETETETYLVQGVKICGSSSVTDVKILMVHLWIAFAQWLQLVLCLISFHYSSDCFHTPLCVSDGRNARGFRVKIHWAVSSLLTFFHADLLVENLLAAMCVRSPLVWSLGHCEDICPVQSVLTSSSMSQSGDIGCRLWWDVNQTWQG